MTTTRTLMATTMVAEDNYNEVNGDGVTGKEVEDDKDGDG